MSVRWSVLDPVFLDEARFPKAPSLNEKIRQLHALSVIALDEKTKLSADSPTAGKNVEFAHSLLADFEQAVGATQNDHVRLVRYELKRMVTTLECFANSGWCGVCVNASKINKCERSDQK
jgi:hypothetical protein